jgi:hypothetical protein
MRKQARMARVELPSKQADGTPNFVDLKSPDDFMACDLFAIHRAVRVKSSANGDTEYSAQEWADDRVNAFLASAITGWSFPAPIPAQTTVAAADVVIGRVMRAKDWAALRRAAQPLMDELEGEGLPDAIKSEGATEAGLPVPGEQSG